MSKALTIQLDDQMEAALFDLAKTSDRTEAEVVVDLVQHLAEKRRRYIELVQQGLDSLDAGRVLTHETVKQELEARLAALGQ